MAEVSNDKMDRSFLTADIPDLVKKMTTSEKVSLLAGMGWWK
jgi:beta-glucosidase